LCGKHRNDCFPPDLAFAGSRWQGPVWGKSSGP
jgi:hypothetical protein